MKGKWLPLLSVSKLSDTIYLGCNSLSRWTILPRVIFKLQKSSPQSKPVDEFFIEFDIFLEYKVKKMNIVVDALSRKIKLTATGAHTSKTQM